MKIRTGFVSNSSSSSFIIKNKSNKNKTIKDFAKETSFLIEEYNNEYHPYQMVSINDFLQSTKHYDEYKWESGEELLCVFGDEEGNSMGEVLDYMLRERGESENFKWRMVECRGEVYDNNSFISIYGVKVKCEKLGIKDGNEAFEIFGDKFEYRDMMWCIPLGSDTIYIGRNFSSIGDEETGKEFKKDVRNFIINNFPILVEERFDTYEEILK